MRRAISYVVFADMIFILLLSVAGLTDGVVSNAVYLSAFLLPASVVLFVAVKGRKEIAPPKLTASPRSLALFLPTVAPTVLLVLGVSAVTSLLLSLFTSVPTTDVSGNVWSVIFRHAFLTAILEELLFRYVPITLLSPRSKRVTVFLSAILFALSHAALYQIPYAFIAGVIFCALDLALDSIWPSVLLHLLNNLGSIFWVRYFENAAFRIAYIVTLSVLAVLSVAIIIIFRRKYLKLISSAVRSGEKERMPYEVWLFALMTLTIAIMNL